MKPKRQPSSGPRSVSAVAARRGPRRCPIVGVGASAGGLEAFTLLLRHLPADTGFGFVLVQHLDPEHASALTQLLARATAMRVREATHNGRVEANCVYVIPPNRSLGIAQGVLKLQPRARDRTALRSIDHFLEALAKDQRERAIGVILSGTATDGTLGLEAIKAEGGLTFAQDDSARYDSMPRSAVAAGCVDLELSPPAIARELARIAKHPSVAGRPVERANPATPTALDDTAAGPPEEAKAYQQILLLLRNHSGVDFSLYKATTIHRRITRRMVLNRHATLSRYAEFLRGNTKELDALYADALINVTSFFRNPEVFDVLRQKVFPKLLQERGDEPVRVWVLGCSTGQEAYSLAMAFTEAADDVVRARKLQVFATDLSEANLVKARHGFYTKTLVQDISPERLRRFFVEEDGGFRIIKPLREVVVFARQNVISDPPFSRMDLISCRNVMIYFEPALQKKVLPTFHYALKPGGCLLLGASESIGGFTHLFGALDKRHKIFGRKTGATAVLQLPLRKEGKALPARGRAPRATLTPAARPGGGPDPLRTEINAEREADRVTVNQFAPAGVLINADLQILQFRGQTGAFLEPPMGKASFDLLKMAREGLMLPLRATITRASRDNTTARLEHVPVRRDGETCIVNVEVVPLRNLKERCFLVLFEEVQPAAAATAPPARPLMAKTPRRVERAAESARVTSLERDLAETRDYLQSIQEYQEAANEELQASNEEGQSANEELQSLNEELETSKEELESTNEELTTVNDEMTSRNTELSRLNSDLTNVETATKFVIVLLGRDLTVRRFSAQAETQFRLLASDVGRPIGAVRHNLVLPDLETIIALVIANVRECEREVRDHAGRWYSLRVRPYLTVDNKVDGAVLVLLDIDDLKRTEQLISAAHEHAEAIIRTVPNPLVTLTADLRVQSTNDAFNRSFKVAPAAIKGHYFFEIDRGAWNTPKLHQLLRDVIPRNSVVSEFEVTHDFPRIGRRSLLLNARVLNEPGGKHKEILLGIQDVTDVLAFQADLRRSELRFRRLFEAAQDGILILDPVTRKITDANPYIVKLLGYSRAQLLKKELWQIGLLKEESANQAAFRMLQRKGFVRYEDLPLKSRGGQHHEVEFVSNLYDEDGGAVIQCNIRDITERKRAERALLASEERYRTLFNSIDEGFCVIETLCNRQGRCVDYRFVEVNPAFERQSGIVQAVGKRIREINPNAEARWFEEYGRVAQTGRAVRFSSEMKGLKAWFDVYAFRLGGPGSARVAVIFSNITERKLAEVALAEARVMLAQYAGQLEKLVTQRTAELVTANYQLLQSVESNQKGKEEFRALFMESQGMQAKLRQLTREIITTQEEERKSISRELHDEVVQTLVGINVELAALKKEAASGAPRLQRKIGRTQRLVEGAVHAVHRFARGLRPAVLDDLGLIAALHAHSKSLAAQYQIAIKLTAPREAEALGGAERTVLYRVAQESLTNVIRHAGATTVVIVIVQIPGALRMEVRDNGKSFAVEKTLAKENNKRLGLVGMRERVEMVGGKLTIESSPGNGTTVRAEVPFAV